MGWKFYPVAIERQVSSGMRVLALFLISGCANVSQERITDTIAPMEKSSGAEKTVRIVKVNNLTGQSKYDDLRHYVHLKAAQFLDNSGRFAVVSDELTEEADALKLFGPLPKASAEFDLEVDIVTVTESAGATYSAVLFSSQKKSALVALRLRLKEQATNSERKAEGQAESAKGAWGVVLQVNRQNMLKGKGFWTLDNSMLGIAAQRALQTALSKI